MPIQTHRSATSSNDIRLKQQQQQLNRSLCIGDLISVYYRSDEYDGVNEESSSLRSQSSMSEMTGFMNVQGYVPW